MEIINFTNTKPKKIDVENVSKIFFGKCFIKKGVETKSLIFTIEFKSPVGHNDADGKPLYNIISRSLDIGTFVDVMDKPNSPTIVIDKFIPIPMSCTIIKLTANNSLDNEFDVDIQVRID